MTRHAKNVTAGNIYTTHERKKDARESGYGSEAIRLGKDSIKVLLNSIFTFLLFLLYFARQVFRIVPLSKRSLTTLDC